MSAPTLVAKLDFSDEKQQQIRSEAPILLRHSCECRCASCESRGAGYFAQLAALQGKPHAAEQLSAPVFAVLAALRSGEVSHE